MNQKPLFLAVTLVALLVIGGAVLVWQKNHRQDVPQQADKSQEVQPQTLDDLLDQAEEIQLPTVDTTGWLAYQDEKLGVGFMYPKGWEVKAYDEDIAFYGEVCIKTANDRYAKMPSSSAQSGQGDECIFQIVKPKINEQFLVSEILQYKKNAVWSEGQLSKIEQSYFSTPILMTLSEDETHFYMKKESDIVTLRVWNMDKKFQGVDDALYGVFQTIKPIQK